MKRIQGVLVATAVAALAGAACQHEEAVSTTQTTSASIVPNDMATENLAYARCQHEYACNAIGASKTYVTLEACMRDQRQRIYPVINVEQCPRGVDGYALQACKTAIDTTVCGWSGPLNECLKTQICR